MTVAIVTIAMRFNTTAIVMMTKIVVMSSDSVFVARKNKFKENYVTHGEGLLSFTFNCNE